MLALFIVAAVSGPICFLPHPRKLHCEFVEAVHHSETVTRTEQVDGEESEITEQSVTNSVRHTVRPYTRKGLFRRFRGQPTCGPGGCG